MWWMLWMVFVVLPGAVFPLGAQYFKDSNPLVVCSLTGLGSVFGMAFATAKIQPSNKVGCWVIPLGMVIMAVFFFIGCASQIRIQ